MLHSIDTRWQGLDKTLWISILSGAQAFALNNLIVNMERCSIILEDQDGDT